MNSNLLTPKEAAAFLTENLGRTVSYNTLALWRSHGKGPAYLKNKYNKRVYYRKEDLIAWMEEENSFIKIKPSEEDDFPNLLNYTIREGEDE